MLDFGSGVTVKSTFKYHYGIKKKKKRKCNQVNVQDFYSLTAFTWVNPANT